VKQCLSGIGRGPVDVSRVVSLRGAEGKAGLTGFGCDVPHFIQFGVGGEARRVVWRRCDVRVLGMVVLLTELWCCRGSVRRISFPCGFILAFATKSARTDSPLRDGCAQPREPRL